MHHVECKGEKADPGSSDPMDPVDPVDSFVSYSF